MGSLAVLSAGPMAHLPVTPVSVEYGNGSDAVASATARVVTAIASYTRWPASQTDLRLCVIGAADHANLFGSIGSIAGKQTETVRIGPESAARSGCNILYLGHLSAEGLRAQTAWARDRSILTIAEADPACRSGAMFCLVYLDDGLTFDLNTDAISRSGLRVDPRVLRLGRGGVS
jgi:hypothetical protein